MRVTNENNMSEVERIPRHPFRHILLTSYAFQVPIATDAGGQLPGAGLDHLGGAEGRARPHPHRQRGADLLRRQGHRLQALPQSQVSRGVGAGQLVSDK